MLTHCKWLVTHNWGTFAVLKPHRNVHNASKFFDLGTKNSMAALTSFLAPVHKCSAHCKQRVRERENCSRMSVVHPRLHPGSQKWPNKRLTHLNLLMRSQLGILAQLWKNLGRGIFWKSTRQRNWISLWEKNRSLHFRTTGILAWVALFRVRVSGDVHIAWDCRIHQQCTCTQNNCAHTQSTENSLCHKMSWPYDHRQNPPHYQGQRQFYQSHNGANANWVREKKNKKSWGVEKTKRSDCELIWCCDKRKQTLE